MIVVDGSFLRSKLRVRSGEKGEKKGRDVNDRFSIWWPLVDGSSILVKYMLVISQSN